MFDLIVVGGGPAGSSAAGLAGKLGLETLLLEQEPFPVSYTHLTLPTILLV